MIQLMQQQQNPQMAFMGSNGMIPGGRQGVGQGGGEGSGRSRYQPEVDQSGNPYAPQGDGGRDRY